MEGLNLVGNPAPQTKLPAFRGSSHPLATPRFGDGDEGDTADINNKDKTTGGAEGADNKNIPAEGTSDTNNAEKPDDSTKNEDNKDASSPDQKDSKGGFFGFLKHPAVLAIIALVVAIPAIILGRRALKPLLDDISGKFKDLFNKGKEEIKTVFDKAANASGIKEALTPFKAEVEQSLQQVDEAAKQYQDYVLSKLKAEKFDVQAIEKIIRKDDDHAITLAENLNKALDSLRSGTDQKLVDALQKSGVANRVNDILKKQERTISALEKQLTTKELKDNPEKLKSALLKEFEGDKSVSELSQDIRNALKE